MMEMEKKLIMADDAGVAQPVDVTLLLVPLDIEATLVKTKRKLVVTGVANMGGVRGQIAKALDLADGGGNLVICIDGQSSPVKQLSELGAKAKVNVWTATQYSSLN